MTLVEGLSKKRARESSDDRNTGFEEVTLEFKSIVHFIDWKYVLPYKKEFSFKQARVVPDLNS